MFPTSHFAKFIGKFSKNWENCGSIDLPEIIFIEISPDQVPVYTPNISGTETHALFPRQFCRFEKGISLSLHSLLNC